MLEIKRKILHMGVSLLVIPPAIYWSMPDLIKGLALVAAVAIFVHWFIDYRDVRRKKFDTALEGMFEAFGEKYDKAKNAELEKLEEDFYKTIIDNVIRAGEKAMVLPTVFALCSFLFAAIFFGKEALVFGVLALSVGDSAAAIAGTYLGRHKIFWNKEKSWEGFFAFAVIVSLASYALLMFFPQFALFNPIKLALLAGLAGALIETIPIIDDNFSIPLLVSGIIFLVAYA